MACECVHGMQHVFLALNLWRNIKVGSYSIVFAFTIAFAFTPIGLWIDPLAPFALSSAFTSAS